MTYVNHSHPHMTEVSYTTALENKCTEKFYSVLLYVLDTEAFQNLHGSTMSMRGISSWKRHSGWAEMLVWCPQFRVQDQPTCLLTHPCSTVVWPWTMWWLTLQECLWGLFQTRLLEMRTPTLAVGSIILGAQILCYVKGEKQLRTGIRHSLLAD